MAVWRRLGRCVDWVSSGVSMVVEEQHHSGGGVLSGRARARSRVRGRGRDARAAESPDGPAGGRGADVPLRFVKTYPELGEQLAQIARQIA